MTVFKLVCLFFLNNDNLGFLSDQIQTHRQIDVSSFYEVGMCCSQVGMQQSTHAVGLGLAGRRWETKGREESRNQSVVIATQGF